MPLKLDVEKILHGKSERVKCVDIHPKEPWILSALYSGNIFIWNFDTETIVRTFEVSEVPVRTAKFIVRKNWLVCGTDDMHIRIYNYNTCEKVKEFEAHTDYIRSIVVHPTLPFILSASDDMSIKLWDWDNGWENAIIFEGHTHYVMQIAINPKDSNSFASASLDRSVKVWGLNSSVPHFQLEGHDRGVNCLAYYSGGERPFLVSGADDNLVKIWDYQTKTCIATLEGHTANISAVMFHPQLPIIISGSEDGALKIWHSNTYRLETTLHYAMERVWTMAAHTQYGGEVTSNKVAIGFDEGTILISLGQEEPIVSMDRSGKVVWAKNHEIQLTKILRGQNSVKQQADGAELQLASDDLGSCEFYPNFLQHNKNGQLIAVCGDGEYTIYTALKLKHKSFGTGLDFAWSATSPSIYATKQSGNKVKIYRNYVEFKSIRTSFQIEKVFGGHLLGVSSTDGDIYFYRWTDSVQCIRRIEVAANGVHWSSEGQYVSIECADNFYVLKYNEEIVDKYIASNVNIEQHGIESAFDLEVDINEIVVSACFSGSIFIYISSTQRLNYYIAGSQHGNVIILQHLDKVYYLLGYIQKANRIYLIDKRCNIISYQLLRYVLAYQAAVVRDDLRTAQMLIDKKKINPKYYNKLAHFLQGQGHIELALKVSIDPEHQFELALLLKKLSLAKQILLKAPSVSKWKQLADLALSECDFVTTEEAAKNANDLALLYLLYTSTNNKGGLQQIAGLAVKQKKFNIAFQALFYLSDIAACLDLLLSTDNIPQAAMFSRAYCPDKIDEIQAIWKQKLKKISPAAANALGDTKTHPNAFPAPSIIAESKKEKEKEAEIAIAVEEKVDVDVDVDVEAEVDVDVVVDLSDDISSGLPSGMTDDDDDDENILNADGDDEDDDPFNLEDLDSDL